MDGEALEIEEDAESDDGDDDRDIGQTAKYTSLGTCIPSLAQVDSCGTREVCGLMPQNKVKTPALDALREMSEPYARKKTGDLRHGRA